MSCGENVNCREFAVRMRTRDSSIPIDEKACSPYTGNDTACSTRTCLRHFTSSYGYVGGYYGGCSEEAMKEALVTGGPLSVSFEVYDDFTMYKSGVYHHVALLSGPFQPLELTNHAVLLVGYGTDEATGEDFWIVKNSWDRTG